LRRQRLQQADELLDLHLGIADQFSKKAWLQGVVVRHCQRLSGGVKGMPEANVAAALADDLISEPLEGPDSFLA